MDSILETISTLVVVVNGVIQPEELKKLQKRTEHIYIRENVGYDVGAYKDCMFHYVGIDEICKYDELILANDTVIGPFVPFAEIFETMTSKKCDFWGMTYIERGFLSHIQSWFLVFRKKALEEKAFFLYFEKNILTTTTDLNQVYSRFEVGVYQYMIKMGYIPAFFADTENIDVYRSPFQYLKKGGVFLKKKIFGKEKANRENIYAAIQYATDVYGFDDSIIVAVAKEKYGFCMEHENRQMVQAKNLMQYNVPDFKFSIEVFKKIQVSGYKIFIYGAGGLAHDIQWALWLYEIPVEKFLVSEFKDNLREINGIEVLEWNEKMLGEKDYLVVALNEKHTKEVRDKLYNIKNVIWLCD